MVDPKVPGQLSDPRKGPAYEMYSYLLAGEYRGPEVLHHLYPNKNNFSTRKKRSSQNSWEEEDHTYELTTAAEAKGSNSACSSGEDSSAAG